MFVRSATPVLVSDDLNPSRNGTNPAHASPNYAGIAEDCRMIDDPALMSLSDPCTLYGTRRSVN